MAALASQESPRRSRSNISTSFAEDPAVVSCGVSHLTSGTSAANTLLEYAGSKGDDRHNIARSYDEQQLTEIGRRSQALGDVDRIRRVLEKEGLLASPAPEHSHPPSDSSHWGPTSMVQSVHGRGSVSASKRARTHRTSFKQRSSLSSEEPPKSWGVNWRDGSPQQKDAPRREYQDYLESYDIIRTTDYGFESEMYLNPILASASETDRQTEVRWSIYARCLTAGNRYTVTMFRTCWKATHQEGEAEELRWVEVERCPKQSWQGTDMAECRRVIRNPCPRPDLIADGFPKIIEGFLDRFAKELENDRRRDRPFFLGKS